VRRLKVKFELGLFDDPYKYCDENRELTTVGKPFQEVVLHGKKIVLLKKTKDLLPLKKTGKNSTNWCFGK
jgi:beta-glucosidase